MGGLADTQKQVLGMQTTNKWQRVASLHIVSAAVVAWVGPSVTGNRVARALDFCRFGTSFPRQLLRAKGRPRAVALFVPAIALHAGDGPLKGASAETGWSILSCKPVRILAHQH